MSEVHRGYRPEMHTLSLANCTPDVARQLFKRTVWEFLGRTKVVYQACHSVILRRGAKHA